MDFTHVMIHRLLCFILLWTTTQATNRPILGILAQESYGSFSYGQSFIPAAYVKAIESSGARVVPVFINQTSAYYEDVMSKINGIVFPGGATNFSAPHGYGEAGKYILDIAKRMNEAEDFFPVLGVCQGFQLLMYLETRLSSESNILTPCLSFQDLPLELDDDFRNSSLFQNASDEILSYLKLNVTSNHHRFCVTEDNFMAHNLAADWKILSRNTDMNGLQFISTAESTLYPFVGLQFHPEKNAYEWNINQTFNPHFAEAIAAGRFFYDWVVIQARKSNHSFSSWQEERDRTIYNYNPYYIGKYGAYIEQAYFFNDTLNPEVEIHYMQTD